MQLYKFDEEGYYIEPIIADFIGEETPENVTDVAPPQPNYRPRFDGEKWIEDAPKPDAPEGKEAVWHGDTKEWTIDDIPKTGMLADAEIREYMEAFILASGYTPESEVEE